MADLKISEMPLAPNFSGNTRIPVVRSGANEAITATTFFANVKDQVVLNVDSEDKDFQVKSVGNQNMLRVDASSNSVGIGKVPTLATLDVDGSIAINGVQINTSVQTQTASGAVDLTKNTTIVDSSSNVALQLGNGQNGQTITVVRKGAGNLTMSGSGSVIVGATTVTFTAVGSSVTLRYIVDAWYIVGAFLVTVA